MFKQITLRCVGGKLDGKQVKIGKYDVAYHGAVMAPLPDMPSSYSGDLAEIATSSIEHVLYRRERVRENTEGGIVEVSLLVPENWPNFHSIDIFKYMLRHWQPQLSEAKDV